MILDAGCGNRAMWDIKTSDNVIFLDVEKELQKKPTIFADNRKMPFPDKTFTMIFFDPPFKWNCDDHPFYSFPNTDKLYEKYPDISPRSMASYYGIERYKTRQSLIAYIYRAEKEIHRVLKDNGVLWLRWCEMNQITHRHVLGIFTEKWNQMLTHQIESAKRGKGQTSSFWFMLMKKPLEFIQLQLEEKLIVGE